jgi:hypothetical protein
MPVYTFRDRETNELIELTLRIADYDSFLSSNPNLERYIDSVPGLVSGSGSIKTDSGFKEVLSKVAEAHPNSELADRTLSRSATQVKVDNAVNKYRQSN